MIRGFYTAASGMLYQNQVQENISQNLANLETNGFKQTYLLATSQEEVTLKNQNLSHSLGSLTMKVGLDEAYLDFSQGDLKSTGRYLDLALEGEGFFRVQGPNNQILYTRDGNFGIDTEGYLVSQEGYRVLSNNGPILVNDEMFSVSTNGMLTVNGQPIQLSIVQLPDRALIQSMGNNTYAYDGNPIQIMGDTVVRQNMLEGSNVNATDEMVALISANQSLQTNAKVLQAMDQIMDLAVNQIGKV